MSGHGVDELRQQRDNASVLKVQLARLRERHYCKLVIVVEGKEDLPVYENWIARADPDYEWEPIVANGKTKALDFLRMLRNDLTGIAHCTYFIVDHDYDGLRECAEGSDVYVLPAYSVENFLVEPRVLDSYLRTELRMVADPEERQKIVELYRVATADFCGLVRDACTQLYGARNESVGNVRVRDIGDSVFIENGSLVIRGGEWLDRLVTTDVPVSTEGVAAGDAFFLSRGELGWIRGKFLFDFFKDFCGVVYRDRISDSPVLFSEKVSDKSLSVAGLDVRNLASKSAIPAGFSEQLRRWAVDCASACKEVESAKKHAV